MNRASILAAEAWAWCEREYARPGVAEQLLREQDEHGLDVMLHLFLAWARDGGTDLDAGAQAELAQSVRPWREDVVQPLRALRRAMKAKPAPGAGSQVEAQAVRELVKQAELRAEKAQLLLMCEWLENRQAFKA